MTHRSPEPTSPPRPPEAGRRVALGAVCALSGGPLLGWPGHGLAADGARPWDESFDTADTSAARSCALMPQQTEGPFLLGAVLDDAGKVRRDITEGRTGVPLALSLKLVDVDRGCAPLAGAAVYVWQCDKDGVYSGYRQPGQDTRGQTFLRGVQVSDARGMVRFDSVYPGWYPGRITHVHFQVHVGGKTRAPATATAQIAFPPEVTQAVYASPLYAGHGQNTRVPDLAADGVFRGNARHQMATLRGSVAQGLQARLLVGVAG